VSCEFTTGIQFAHTGFVNVVAPQYAENLRRNVEMLKGLGVNTMALTGAELKELQPFANVEDVGAAAYEPDSGYANPAETVEGFRRRAVELGARVLQWTPVTKVIRQESRVTGVETLVGRIDAGSVIVAAGAWSKRLCEEFGLSLPMRPKAIDTVAVSRPPALEKSHMVFIDNVLGNYFRPSAKRRRLNGSMSTVFARPSVTSSAMHIPTAGAILNPEPLNAVARYKPSMPSTRPRIAWRSAL
jgi:glycine/D-amino acid oxidase-like deaminating enzyme